jgi:membrane protease YdiL (CAAX protease family)
LNHSSLNKSDELSNEALHQLEQASKTDPNNVLLLVKVIIVSDYLDKGCVVYLDHLRRLHPEIGAELVPVVSAIYGKPPSVSGALSAQIEKTIPPGWYRNQALLKLYELDKDKTAYSLLNAKLKLGYRQFFTRIGLMLIIGICLALSGCIVIVVQLFNLASVGQDFDKIIAPADYGWIAVYAVFIAWLATQILTGILLQPLTSKLKLVAVNSLTMALVIALVYLVSNGPALLYIYFFALKPNKVKLIEGLKLLGQTGKIGPVGMVGCGILAWLAAIPVVSVAYMLASRFFGSHGSNNPIIAVVMQAAHSANLLAVVLFYLTLSFLAPFCEESLFRGFLYSFLRRHMNIPLSIFISASLFALLHVDAGGMLPLFCLGSIFAFLFERTKSILPSIIAHGLWNGSTFTLVLLLYGS